MGAISEVATTVAESAVTSKKLRVKILAKKPVHEACEISQATVVNSLKKQPLTDGKGKALVVEKMLESNQGTKSLTGCLRKSIVNQNPMTPVILDTKFVSVAGSKRKSDEVLEGRERKRLKMDRLATSKCQTILTKLMKNKLGGPFCMPVDPKAWGIEDYFDIIKNPMDLGTIQKKLLKKTYTHVEEFEADVRLTFSNAMLYNPPDNWVHISAKELDMLFTSFWKFDGMRMDGEHKNVKHQVEMKQRGLVSSHDKITCNAQVKSDRMRMDGEHKIIKQQVDIKQRCPENSHDKITLHEKGKCSVSRSSQVGQLPQKATPQKEKGLDTLKKVSVGGQQFNDLNVVRDDKPKEPLSFKELDLNAFPSTTSFKELDSNTFPSTTSFLGATAQGLETMDVEVSPSKALRVARLRSRFADTILKAQHQTLLKPGSETNKANWQQEKLILERRQQEEKARIEAQIRAVESAARLKADSELKQQREAARKESRLALEKMKQSVNFEDNLLVLRDLEAMVGSSLVVVCHDRRSHSTVWSQIDSKNLSPLQRLGLYIKKEYMVGDDDDYDFDMEDGEII